jgi:hypothetical protein
LPLALYITGPERGFIAEETGMGGNVACIEDKRNGNWRIKSLRRKYNTKMDHKGYNERE